MRDIGQTCFEALERLKAKRKKAGERGGSIIKVGTKSKNKAKAGADTNGGRKVTAAATAIAEEDEDVGDMQDE